MVVFALLGKELDGLTIRPQRIASKMALQCKSQSSSSPRGQGSPAKWASKSNGNTECRNDDTDASMGGSRRQNQLTGINMGCIIRETFFQTVKTGFGAQQRKPGGPDMGRDDQDLVINIQNFSAHVTGRNTQYRQPYGRVKRCPKRELILSTTASEGARSSKWTLRTLLFCL